MSDIAIRAHQLSKRYRIGLKEQVHDTLASTLLDWVKSPAQNLRQLRRLTRFSEKGKEEDDVLWALKDVSFEIKQGEVVGVIGQNGAGKSTLLKILSRITQPTSGRVELHGRVSSLLEVGTGFHPELTGRENIYLNGTILGMSRKEIDKKFDEIVDFSGVEKFIDTPVKRYSSGMAVRLAFSVAAHLEPEILLVDEVLAVGDAEFQKKCLGKMGEVAREGRTVLFVSHHMAAIQNLCPTCILFRDGKIISNGETHSVVAEYMQAGHQTTSISLKNRLDRTGTGYMRFQSMDLLNGKHQTVQVGQTGSPLSISLSYDLNCDDPGIAIFQLTIKNVYGQEMFKCLSRNSYPGNIYLEGEGKVVCRFPKLPLLPGRYSVSIWCKLNESVADEILDAFQLDVITGDFFSTGKINSNLQNGLLADHSWEFLSETSSVRLDTL